MKFIAVLLIVAMIVPQVADLCSPDAISKVVRGLEELSQSYVNVTSAVRYADKWLKACGEGNYTEAVKAYTNVSEEVMRLSVFRDSSRLGMLLYKALTTLVFVLIPIAIYLLLPRVYLYLWYSSKKRWFVVKRK